MVAKPQVVFWDARECAPGPQGRLNRPSSTISLVVGRRRRPIDGLSISQTDSYVAERVDDEHGQDGRSYPPYDRVIMGHLLRSDPVRNRSSKICLRLPGQR